MENSLTTRQRLLEAAISIIETHGEGAIRVDQVAELAGFTKPVLYSYFKNREELRRAGRECLNAVGSVRGYQEARQPSSPR